MPGSGSAGRVRPWPERDTGLAPEGGRR